MKPIFDEVRDKDYFWIRKILKPINSINSIN